MSEEWSKEWNPFNSYKLLAHLETWRKIKRGERLPPPITVSLDPINSCNLKCGFCNSEYIRNHNPNSINSATMSYLGRFLSGWGVRSVCIGGMESMLHPNFDNMCTNLDYHGVKMGLVTNGTKLDISSKLDKMTWVGVSVNSGTPKTYQELMGRPYFGKVIEQIRTLNERTQGTRLQEPGQGHGVSYKYLLQPKNVNEVYESAKIAKDIGCRNIHIRPVANPWDRKLGTIWSEQDLITFREQLERARGLEDNVFGVFGVTHKFDGNFGANNPFEKCYAIFMNGNIQPPSSPKQGEINFSLCCDRRGDRRLTLENIAVDDIKTFWGSDAHWKMYDYIDPKKCERCTYTKHNQIYEQCILKDSLTEDFI